MWLRHLYTSVPAPPHRPGTPRPAAPRDAEDSRVPKPTSDTRASGPHKASPIEGPVGLRGHMHTPLGPQPPRPFVHFQEWRPPGEDWRRCGEQRSCLAFVAGEFVPPPPAEARWSQQPRRTLAGRMLLGALHPLEAPPPAPRGPLGLGTTATRRQVEGKFGLAVCGTGVTRMSEPPAAPRLHLHPSRSQPGTFQAGSWEQGSPGARGRPRATPQPPSCHVAVARSRHRPFP